MDLNGQETLRLSLGEDLGLRKASEHHEKLIDALQSHSSIIIEFPDNHQADVSTVQLIESARIFASTCGKKLKLAKPASGSLLSVLERGGFLTNTTPEDSNFWMHNGE
ncbi:hypothetical protein ACFSE1_03360 [Rhizobium helianthi]|uniref:STAS domain-containing protein n=1 Tax=Rhizobium helianthi TaxID=1132695 RepID=A0ABW4M1Q6_9HYPH